MEINTSEILNIYNETLYIKGKNVETLDTIGNFNKKILIFTTQIDAATACQELLHNMLKACGLQLEDCYCIEIANANQAIPQINIHQPKIILSFGVMIGNELFKLNSNAIYKIQTIGQAKVILSHTLDSMIKNPALKSDLWQSLKNIFNIK